MLTLIMLSRVRCRHGMCSDCAGNQFLVSLVARRLQVLHASLRVHVFSILVRRLLALVIIFIRLLFALCLILVSVAVISFPIQDLSPPNIEIRTHKLRRRPLLRGCFGCGCSPSSRRLILGNVFRRASHLVFSILAPSNTSFLVPSSFLHLFLFPPPEDEEEQEGWRRKSKGLWWS